MSFFKKLYKYIIVFAAFTLSYSSLQSQVTGVEPDSTVNPADSFYVKYGDSIPFGGVSYQVIYIPSQSFVTIEVFEYDGKKVATLFEGALERGGYKIEVMEKLKDEPMGMYFLKVHADVTAEERHFQNSFLKYTWFVLVR